MKFLSPPQMPSGTANPATGSAGALFYRTDTNQLMTHDGTTWVAVGGSSAGGATVSDTAPVGAAAGTLWFESDTGKLYIAYQDANSTQWVEVGGGGGSSYMLGAIYPWAADTVPPWGLELAGQAVSRTTYSGLFAILGTTYGNGDGSTTFNLPDYRGRTLVGKDSAQTEFDTIGEVGGAKTHTLTITEMPAHAHFQTAIDSTFAAGGGSALAGMAFVGGTYSTSSAATTGAGLDGPHNNLQPYRVVKWIICAFTNSGEFDSAVQAALVARTSATPLSCNYIVNSRFDIWQRGTSFAHTSLLFYSADRWEAHRSSNVSGMTTLKIGPVAIPGVSSSISAIRVSRTNSTTNFIRLAQTLESVDSSQLAGKTVTLSYYARVGTAFVGTIRSSIATGLGTDVPSRTGYPGLTDTPVVVSPTTSWQRFSQTLTLPDNITQVGVWFTWNPSGTPGADNYFDITGVQLEVGDTATPYAPQNPSIASELDVCQRYYYRMNSTAAGKVFGMALVTGTTGVTALVPFPSTMRRIPDFESSAATTFEARAATTLAATAVVAAGGVTADVGAVDCTVAGATAGQAAILRSTVAGATSAFLAWNAEF